MAAAIVGTMLESAPAKFENHRTIRMMTPLEMEQVLRNVDVRTATIEQILPTLATKEDLKVFATKEELAAAVTTLRGEIEETRRHSLVLHEDVKADIRMLAEHLAHVLSRLDRIDRKL
jgi:hypothetical protein